jgi:hypothetical protein
MSRTHHTLLARNHSLRLVGPHRVLAQQGTLWLTCDGEPTDWVLEPGSSLLLDGRTPVLVTALGDAARVATTPLAPASLAQRLQQVWQGLTLPRRALPDLIT